MRDRTSYRTLEEAFGEGARLDLEHDENEQEYIDWKKMSFAIIVAICIGFTAWVLK